VSPANSSDNARNFFGQAVRFLAAADVLAAGGFWDRATSQLYFAVVQAARAALVTEGIEARTHRSLASLVGLHLVRTGKLGKDTSRALGDLQVEREGADYASSYPNDEPRFLELRTRAQAAIDEVRSLLLVAGVRPGEVGD